MSSSFCSVYDGSGTPWPLQPFPGNYFAGWDSQRRFKAQQAWNFFEQVESADAATRVRLGGTGWTPPPLSPFAQDPSIWYNLNTEGALTLYRLGKSLHQQVCPGTNWQSQRSYGISAIPVTNVYPGVTPCNQPQINPCDTLVQWSYDSINGNPTFICSDISNRCIISGSWQTDPLTVVNSSGTIVSSMTNTGGFITVFNQDSTFGWSAELLGASVIVSQVISDQSGNIICLGTFNAVGPTATITLYSAAGAQTIINTVPTIALSNIFIAQYSPSGVPNWCATIAATSGAGTGASLLSSCDIAIGNNNSVLVLSDISGVDVQFYNAHSFPAGPTYSAVNPNIGIYCITSAGALAWNAFVTTANSTPANIYNTGSSILISGYITNAPLTIQDSTGAITNLPFTTLLNSPASIIANFSPSGMLQWRTVAANNTSGSASNFPGGLYLNPNIQTKYIRSVIALNSNTYHIGSLQGTGPVNFINSNASSSLTLTPLASLPPSYVARIDSNGTYNWVAKIDYPIAGTVSVADLYGIIFLNTNLYVCGTTSGSFSNKIIFYTITGLPTLFTIPGQCSFIASYDVNGSVVWVRYFTRALDYTVITLIPDTTGGIYVYFVAYTTVLFYDQNGSVIKTLVLPNNNPSQILAKYDTDGNLMWGGIVGSCAQTMTTWITDASCGGVFTVGAARIDSTSPCNIYDASGNVIASFSNQALINAISSFWKITGT